MVLNGATRPLQLHAGAGGLVLVPLQRLCPGVCLVVTSAAACIARQRRRPRREAQSGHEGVDHGDAQLLLLLGLADELRDDPRAPVARQVLPQLWGLNDWVYRNSTKQNHLYAHQITNDVA